jgi:uncharacterized membrane protein YeiB
MTSHSLGPVTSQERIQTIDIIRGIALFGILVINFCVDDGDVSPMEGRTGFGDQLIWWSVRLFMDDRFQTIYCFLFGLGFAIQLQRAADRNAGFGFFFLFLRRMIALYLIATLMYILSGEGYNVLPYYAMVGILLLLFWKVPFKFLPWLAILLFIVYQGKSIIQTSKAESKREAWNSQSKTIGNIDTTILDKYVGVYEMEPGDRQIFIRNRDTLFGEGPGRRYILTPLSDTHFFRKDLNWVMSFHKDSSDTIKQVLVRFLDGRKFKGTKINTNLQEALKKQLQNRRGANNAATINYKQSVERNINFVRNFFKNWSWQGFFWRNNYPISYILVLFLLGAYAGRRKLFHEVNANKQLLTKLFLWGLIAGGATVAINIGFGAWNYFKGIKWESYSLLTRTLINQCWNIGIILMALGYIAGITLLMETEKWKKRFFFFSLVGRLGLTNYILHIVAYVLIFKKFELCLGLAGKIGPLYRFLFAILVYVLLYLFSRWWLKHFKYGPFEWLWRSLTYLKFQPMRLKTKNNTESS